MNKIILQKPYRIILEEHEAISMLSERDVIAASGIARSTYRSWKDGTSEPMRRWNWIRLASVFGQPVEKVMFGLDCEDFSELRKEA